MNQNLLDYLWEKAQRKALKSSDSQEPEDLHDVSIVNAIDGYDYMVLKILIEGCPEWHYRRRVPNGLWQSVTDNADRLKDEVSQKISN